MPLATVKADVLYRFFANFSYSVIDGQLIGLLFLEGRLTGAVYAGVLEHDLAGLLENVRTAQRNAPAQRSTQYPNIRISTLLVSGLAKGFHGIGYRDHRTSKSVSGSA